MTLLSLQDLALAHPPGPLQPPDLEDVDLDIAAGEQVALLGESGSGLSLLAPALLAARGAGPVLRGGIWFDHSEAGRLRPQQLARQRKGGVEFLSTDPAQGFDPARALGRQIRAPRATLATHLTACGIADPPKVLATRARMVEPRLLTRVALAAALARQPRLMLVNALGPAEPIAMADQMMLLRQQCRASDVALLLLTSQPALAAEMADRIAVFYAGRLVEDARAVDVIRRPRHPYTAALIRALPERTLPNTPLAELPGEAPSAETLPQGCRFHPRCSHALAGCYLEPPQMTEQDGRCFACHWPLEVE